MSCNVKVYSPKTGEYINSKTWSAINSEVLNEELADNLFAKTRSESFKAWFGDVYNPEEASSQVVTEDGEPLLVYHSSPYEFDTFDTNKSNELGFHFGTLKAALERFSPGKIVSFEDDISGEIIDIPLEDRRKDLKSDGFSVRPFYLNIRNMIEGVDNIDFDSGKLKDSEDGDLLKYLDEATYSNDFKRLVLAFYQKGKITYDDVNQILTTEDSILSSGIHGPEALRKALGNPDGYWYKNVKEDEGSISYVVFDPKNIKSIYNEGSFSQDENIFYNIKSETAVDFTLKVINALQKTPRKTYPSGNIQGFYNDLIKQGAPKNQIDLLKDYILKNNIQEINVPDLIAGLASEISYTIEINTTKGQKTKQIYLPEENQYEEVNARNFQTIHQEVWDEGIFEPQTPEFHAEVTRRLSYAGNENSDYYSYLTVPGGTNYTENEIATPAIVPSIKGHAQFATDNGIGWFRSDDKNSSTNPSEWGKKIRRILEVQSDLFQKGRNKEDLIDDIYLSQRELKDGRWEIISLSRKKL